MSTTRSRSSRLECSPKDDIGPERALSLAITLVAAALAGTTAGILAWVAGRHPANAILTGGGAFVATTLLFLTLIRFAMARRW